MIRLRHPRRSLRRQAGVALFVALISMVVLSLGAIVLIRSMETTLGAAGNIAFRQASMSPVNDAIERSADALFYTKSITDTGAVDLANHYYPALLAATDLPNGMPAILGGDYPPPAYDGAGLGSRTDPAGYEIRWVIERVCVPGYVGAAPPDILQNCDLLPPKLSPARTTMKLTAPKIPPFPFYRVSIRIDEPNSRTTTFAQAMLR
ncbi:MAG TPA: hypothetical protein VGI14_01230 [Casimicrobiaceae bacterium]|jgi:hypothetical protein